MRSESPGVQLTPEPVMLIRQSARRLREEFAGTFNAETIERYIAEIVRGIRDDIRTRVEALVVLLDLNARA